MAQLNFGETDVLPMPGRYEWRVSQSIFRDKEGDEHFYTRLTVLTAVGVHVVYLSPDSGDNERLANQIIRIDRMNRKGIRDTDPGNGVVGATELPR